MRLDVVVNMLTIRALVEGYIEIKTPELYRPHCHIEDITDLYMFLLERPHLRGPYNAGFDNQTIAQTAALIAKEVGCEVREAPKEISKYDKRSYLVDSELILREGFRPKFGVKDAITGIVGMYRAGALRDDDECYNLKWMMRHGWVSAAN
jgi:nucleoside-diphosphate-sugar epimerase